MPTKVLFLVPIRENTSLIDSIMKELVQSGLHVEVQSYVSREKQFFGSPSLDLEHKTQSRYDVVVVLDLGYLNGAKVRKKFPHTPLILFAGDTPQSLAPDSLPTRIISRVRTLVFKPKSPFQIKFGVKSSAKHYNLILASDPRAVDELRNLGLDCRWFPYWSQTSGAARVQHPRAQIDFDISTVMTPRTERLELLGFLKGLKNFRFRHEANVKENEIQEIYSNSLCVLNRSSFGELTIRFFEAFSVGRVVVTNRLHERSGVRELFQEGKHYFTYETHKQLTEILGFLTSNREQTIAFGLEAQKIVLMSHLATNRASQLEDIIDELMRR